MSVVARGGITEGGVSGVAQALTRFGPKKTLEGSAGFTTGLTSSSSRTHRLQVMPSKVSFLLNCLHLKASPSITRMLYRLKQVEGGFLVLHTHL